MIRDLEHYRSVLEHFGGLICRFDRDLKLVECLGASEAICGHSAAELLGGAISLKSLIHPEDLLLVQDAVERMMTAEGGDCEAVEFRILRPDGSQIWVEQGLSRVPDTPEHLQGTLFDVTERKRFEKLLLESERLFDDFVENTPIGIYRTTPSGKVLMANPALLRMLGYDSWLELSERDLEREGFGDSSPRCDFTEAIERDGSISDRQSVWLRRDGRPLYVIESARAVKNEQGQTLYYEGIVQDLTALAETRERVETLEERIVSLQDGGSKEGAT